MVYGFTGFYYGLKDFNVFDEGLKETDVNFLLLK